MKESLLKVHKSIYKYLKTKAETFEGTPSAALKKYRSDQLKSSKRNFKDSNIRELTESIEDSDVIYLGDFHTFDQSTRNLERLIRVLTSKRHKFTIALELVDVKHQRFIDYYLNNHITELEFLESINYKESWRFPWTYYSIFFRLAKKEGIPILALNTSGTLKSRDNQASKVISKYHNENSDHKLLVLMGEYHIVSDKLPQKVMKATKKNVIQTIIHQNLDEVYWKLVTQNKNTKDKVVKFNKREYVLITSAPWLKYESQIYWYEHLSEDPEFDIHEYIIETGALNFSENVPDNFAFICEELIKTIDLKLSMNEIEDFHIYDHINLDKIQKDISKITPVNLHNFYIDLIKRGRSFTLANKNKFFCPNYSINRVSYLAGIHVNNLQLKKQGFNRYKHLQSRKRDEIFVYFLKQCMVAYFTSKLINPYRKCDMYADYKKLIKLKSTKDTKKNLYKVGLTLCDSKKAIRENIKGIKLLGLYNLARMLGHMYADIWFDHHFAGGKNHFKEILELILSPDMSEENFFEIREQIFKDIDYKKMQKRIF